MSILHVRHIKGHLENNFVPLLDLEDLGGLDRAQQHTVRSRALAAYAVQMLSQADVADACASVTDGTQDNGIDAVYVDPNGMRIYVVQTKWIESGSGEPDLGAVKKFKDGITDLINLRFDKFNDKIRRLEEPITDALGNPSFRLSVVIAYTSNDGLAEPAMTDMNELIEGLNDANELVELHVLKQPQLHRGLMISVQGEPVNLEIKISSVGRRQTPHAAWYGQVAARDVAEWWRDHRERLFSRNLRGLLSDTEINIDIRSTLLQSPDYFWYFNNGITLVASSVERSLAHSGSTETALLNCKNVSVVNGAQTVGTIGRFADNPGHSLDGAEVPVRVIALGDAGDEFGARITRSNNRQNKIESRDFVALDPEQLRIQQELAHDGIAYQLLRTGEFQTSPKAFDVAESTVALACATGDGWLAVQLKRELGRMWEDLSKPPYRRLFNPGVSGMYVWRCVQTQRHIDSQIEVIANGISTAPGTRGVMVHGNRIIAALVFGEVRKDTLMNSDSELGIESRWIADRVVAIANALTGAVQSYFPRDALPTLFKNAAKCRELIDICRHGGIRSFEQMALSFEAESEDGEH